jgi:methionyl-tRNA formyltransferase
MNNVILCGYREWAFRIFEKISDNPNINVIATFKSNQEFKEQILTIGIQSIDFIVFIGWSWIIEKEVTQKFLCLGIHPSDLPYFRGGSPLQHQIMRGVTKSKVTLMTLSPDKIDAGEIWLKEDLDLSGDSMNDVFKNLITSSSKLLNAFLNEYPGIIAKEQNIKDGTYYKRRKPEESRLSKEDFANKTLKELYDFIRSLTDPYPNAYIEDEFGNKLVFKNVTYIEKLND